MLKIMIAKSIYTELEELLQHIKILSPTSFLFRDQLYGADRITKYSLPYFTNSIVNLQLKDLLYVEYHCRTTPAVLTGISYHLHNSSIQDFVGTLSDANTGQGTWDLGWEIMDIENDGELMVYKDGLYLWVSQAEFLPSRKIVERGECGCVRLPKECRELMPGFYIANGNSVNDESKNTLIIRVYWNIERTYAPLLTRLLTEELNENDIPFSFKILSNPHQYPRADAAILYVNKQYYHRLRHHLQSIYSQIMPFLSFSTPLFAKRLAPGLSIAEDPDNTESFGQNRCRILSEALYRCNEKNISSIGEGVAHIASYFGHLGINLDKPYLNPHSSDDYDIILS
jgi:HopA1 effector protein family